MIQTDFYGSFNRDVRRYNPVKAEIITNIANELRISLRMACNPDLFETRENYINDLVANYRWFARITLGENHYHSFR
jgi:hypothetical protein